MRAHTAAYYDPSFSKLIGGEDKREAEQPSRAWGGEEPAAMPVEKQPTTLQGVGGGRIKRKRHRENYMAKRKAKQSTQCKVNQWRKCHLNRAKFTATVSNATGLPHTIPGFIGLRDHRQGQEDIPYMPSSGYRYIRSLTRWVQAQ